MWENGGTSFSCSVKIMFWSVHLRLHLFSNKGEKKNNSGTEMLKTDVNFFRAVTEVKTHSWTIVINYLSYLAYLRQESKLVTDAHVQIPLKIINFAKI